VNTNLTEAQIDSYRDNGFIVIHDFLTAEELEIWRDAVDEAVAKLGKWKLAGQKGNDRWQEGDSYYDRVFVQRINLWQADQKVRKLMLDPRLGKMAAQLAGVEGIRLYHDQALHKAPWANPTAWHLDDPFWSFSSPAAISIWVALDDSTLENGCLYFMPGTHKRAAFKSSGIGEKLGDLFDVYPQWAQNPTVAAPMKAGSCSFHNGLVAHAAAANMTPGWRRAMACLYMPDGSRFNGNQDVLPDSYIATLNIGDPLDNDDQNPLIFHPAKPVVTA
jgi:ectoine hydroxylase-related dioxygenase (phytanoyl-CoA dioxygenase family)